MGGVCWPLLGGCVFSLAGAQVQFGLVASLNRPGGNLTGVNALSAEVGAKGLALLHELVPSAATIAFLENPNNPISELTTRDLLAAAPVVGVKVQILKASTDRETRRRLREPGPSTDRGAASSVVIFFSTAGLSRSLHSPHDMRFRPCTYFVTS